MGRFVVGVSGASGVVLAWRTLIALGERGHDVELVMTSASLYTATIEMGKEFSSAQKFVGKLPENIEEHICIHSNNDVGSAICSGSYKTDGMLIIPCSMATLAAVATGLADNALRRAADVTIKEKRRLVIVPRETPLSTIHLRNMLTLAEAGAVILPPVPAWYTATQSIEAMEWGIVGRALDLLGVDHNLYKRWKEESYPCLESG